MRKIKNSKVVSVRIGALELDLLGIKAKSLGRKTSVASLVRRAVTEFVMKAD